MTNDKSIRPRSLVRRAALAGPTLLLLLTAVAPALAATLVSETTWGGAGSESTAGAAVAPDGSTYLAGTTGSFGVTPRVIFLVKFAPDGSLSWQRTWEGPQQFIDDEANDVAVAPDGSVYVTGLTLGVGGDALLLKFAPDGSLVWQRSWGRDSAQGNTTDRGEDVAVAGDGSVYVVGGSSNQTTGEGGVFVLRFTPGGALTSERIWQNVGGRASVAIANDGGIYLAGVAARPGALNSFDVVLLKLDAAGAIVWQRAYSAAEVADARGGLAVAPDGSLYVAGGIQAVRQSSVVNDATLLKFTADGSLVWDRSWGGRSGDFSGTVAVAANGTVLWAGDSNSFGAGSDDAFLLHVSPDGKVMEGQTWGGAGLEHGEGVAVAPGGTISLGATADGPPYSFLRAPTKTSRLRGTVATPTTTLDLISGTLADPGGTVATPNGGTTFAGATDAALVRITP